MDKPTLGNIVDSCKRIADLPSSLKCLHTSDSECLVNIQGQLFEIRYVTYLDTVRPIAPLFGDFVDAEKLRDLVGVYKEINPGLHVYAFMQSDSIKEKGIYFTVSLRPIYNDDLFPKLPNPEIFV